MRPSALPVKGFLLRLAACLVVLGGLYLLVFGWPTESAPKQPATDSQKLADIRAALDETYIAGQQLDTFSTSSPTAFDQLNSLESQFTHSVNHLKQALNTAPPSLTPELLSSLRQQLASDQSAIKTYTKGYQPLSQVIQYNPADDLPPLNAQSSKTVADRAAAARKGLQKAGASPLVSPEIRTALQLQADCFDKLTRDLTNQQLSSTTLTRQQCVSQYSALRLQVIQSVIQPAWGGDYAAHAKKDVPALLKRLDKLVKAQS